MIVRQSELARMAGVSRTAVNQAVKEGRLDLNPDGKIKTTDEKTVKYLKDHIGDAAPKIPEIKIRTSENIAGNKKAKSIAIEKTEIEALENMDRDLLEKMKLLADFYDRQASTRHKDLVYEIKEKSMIEKDVAEYLFFAFIERLTGDLARLPRKIENRIKNLSDEKDHDGIIKELERGITACIKDAKKKQAEEIMDYYE